MKTRPAAFRTWVERVHANGEAAILVRVGQPLARIVPVRPVGQGAGDLITFLRRWRSEHPEPDEQFAQAIRESRDEEASRRSHDATD